MSHWAEIVVSLLGAPERVHFLALLASRDCWPTQLGWHLFGASYGIAFLT